MVSELQFWIAYVAIFVTCLIGILYGIYNCISVLSINTEKLPEEVEVQPTKSADEGDIKEAEKQDPEKQQPKIEEDKKADKGKEEEVTQEKIDELNNTAKKIQAVYFILI